MPAALRGQPRGGPYRLLRRGDTLLAARAARTTIGGACLSGD